MTPAPELGAIASGSRLRAVWEVTGGARRLAYWHDTKLGVDCAFEGFVFGREHRCLPSVASISVGYRFADAACTEPVAETYGCQPPRYGVVPSPNSCASAPDLYELGEPVDPSSVFSLENNHCQPATVVEQAYRVGRQVPITELVAAREEPDDRGQLWLVADDGARIPWGGWDNKRAVQPTHTNDGELRWAPWVVAYQPNYTFVDPACTVLAAGKDAHSAYCPMDAVLLFSERTADSCHAIEVSFAELGRPLDRAYNNNTGRCLELTPATSNQLHFELGPSIPNEDLLDAGSVDEGEGAIRVRRATMRGEPILQTRIDPSFGGNAPPGQDAFIDAATGTVLHPQPATDGLRRALPGATSFQIRYADPACTEHLVVIPPDDKGCAEFPQRIAIQETVEDFCAAKVSVFPVLDPVAAGTATFYDDGAGGCLEGPPAEPEIVYRLGAEIPADAFAEVTIEVDG